MARAQPSRRLMIDWQTTNMVKPNVEDMLRRHIDGDAWGGQCTDHVGLRRTVPHDCKIPACAHCDSNK
ncbi:hypothetical protein PLICRDRAFT_42565 [Plicaturopsis crispa FD-325 SS-3]|nr:hypothetical protein PLICRDRAFT_42565 [Plicaturopsis crispa FD-325 SS-3]